MYRPTARALFADDGRLLALVADGEDTPNPLGFLDVAEGQELPTREQIAEALSRAPQHWAVVLRADRAVRAASAVERINTGREYGEGFEAVARRAGPEHRVYARCVKFAA